MKVPPIIIQIMKNQPVVKKYDMSAVKTIFTGAAPLGAETAEDLQKLYPSWLIRQGYGLTETSTVVCSSSEHDICFGTSGSLISGVYAKIISFEGKEITGYDEPGELVVQSPSVVLGYLNNDEANKETFLPDTDGKGRWMKTGDEAIIRKSPQGNEHIIIVDRIKELIKVKVRIMAFHCPFRMNKKADEAPRASKSHRLSSKHTSLLIPPSPIAP